MSATKPKLVSIHQKTGKAQPKKRPGAAQMREAADLVMDRDCMEIAEALSTNSKNGQIQSAKFLYELSEKNEESADSESAGKLRSMAMELANSPQWTGPPPKADIDDDDEGGE
jgi:hypothetical protein